MSISNYANARAGARRGDSRQVSVNGLQGKVNKAVLAYSGGLDTSVILKWLQEEYDCEVVTFTADLGQVRQRASVSAVLTFGRPVSATTATGRGARAGARQG
jgi:hypothetical protein